VEPEHAKFFEYSKAADPIGLGLVTPIPIVEFFAQNHLEGETRIIPFDNSKTLQTNWSATTPSLLANYIRINPGDTVTTNPNSASEVYYCIRGRGTTVVDFKTLEWKKGDVMTIPAGLMALHTAFEDTAFYWVHDAPLLEFLGVKSNRKCFEVTLYPAEVCKDKLEEAEYDPKEQHQSRVSILLGNELFQSRKTTPTLWTMYGFLPKKSVQPPHRHNSVALDFIVSCARSGCYTLIGDELDENGNIINPTRFDWKAESSFLTPSFKWHSHHNESNEDAFLIPIQDAGLQTHLRTLNIQFSQPRAFIAKENERNKETGKTSK